MAEALASQNLHLMKKLSAAMTSGGQKKDLLEEITYLKDQLEKSVFFWSVVIVFIRKNLITS